MFSLHRLLKLGYVLVLGTVTLTLCQPGPVRGQRFLIILSPGMSQGIPAAPVQGGWMSAYTQALAMLSQAGNVSNTMLGVGGGGMQGIGGGMMGPNGGVGIGGGIQGMGGGMQGMGGGMQGMGGMGMGGMSMMGMAGGMGMGGFAGKGMGGFNGRKPL